MVDDETFRRTVAQLGVPFLGYVLSVDEETLAARLRGDVRLSPEGEQALADVVAHAVELGGEHPFGSSSALPDGTSKVRMRRFGWTDLDRGENHANLFRLATGGSLAAIPEGLDASERAVAAAAVDYFPITLLPVDPEQAFPPQRPLIARARVEALDAVIRDEPLGELAAPGTVFYTSSGMGYGPLAAGRLLECVLVTADQRTGMLGERSSSAFVEEVLGNLRIMRKLVVTGRCDVPAVVGFWNVEMAADMEFTGPRGGRLRAARDLDPHVPMSQRATMALDTTCEVGFSRGELPPAGGGSFYSGVELLAIEEKLVCLAGLLTTPGRDEQVALPMVAWTQIFDPFQPYVGMFASASADGPPTVALPVGRLPALKEWLTRLDAHYDPSIRVASQRTVSAVGERRPWDDALIDFVIALENLFGGPGPKLEGRISGALAALLGTTASDRAGIAARSRRVYMARSRLVHGDELKDDGDHPQEEAQRLVLDALRTLFTTHSHLIPDRRARRLLGSTG